MASRAWSSSDTSESPVVSCQATRRVRIGGCARRGRGWEWDDDILCLLASSSYPTPSAPLPPSERERPWSCWKDHGRGELNSSNLPICSCCPFTGIVHRHWSVNRAGLAPGRCTVVYASVRVCVDPLCIVDACLIFISLAISCRELNYLSVACTVAEVNGRPWCSSGLACCVGGTCVIGITLVCFVCDLPTWPF
jgi:hypothetical protein